MSRTLADQRGSLSALITWQQASRTGVVTSATAAPGTGWIAIVRVRWDAAAADLTVDGNDRLVRIRSMD